MSDFSQLRAARRAKEKQKSYTLRERGQVQPILGASKPEPTVGETVQVQENLYGTWRDAHFEIRDSFINKGSARGRGVFSRKQYRPGDILVSVKPPISVLSIANLPKYCSSCSSPAHSDGGGLRRCTGCKVVHYCSTECQNRDWSMHKPECVALQSWAQAAPSADVGVPSDAVRCLGRMLWRKQKSGEQSIFSQEMDAMQSHRTSLQPTAYELHTHLAHALVRYLNLSSQEEMAAYGLTSIADLVDFISRFTTNSVALSTPSLTPIGVCISSSIALLNHSCDPNVAIVFPRASTNPKLHEPLLQIISLKLINPGEELFTAYIDTTLPREERQKNLKETYNFECQCPLCSIPSKVVDPREALLCPTREDSSMRTCDGLCQIPTEATPRSNAHCTICNTSIDASSAEDVLDAIRVSVEGLGKARELQYKDPERAMRLTSNLIGILTSAGLAPGAHPLLGLSRLHSAMLVESLPDLSAAIGENPPPQQDLLLGSSSISTQQATGALQQGHGEEEHDLPQTQEDKNPAEDAQQKLDNAIRAALRTSSGLTAVLEPGHPLRGISFAELGKLLSVDEPMPRYLAGKNDKNVSSVYPPSGPARLRLARETLVRARAELMIGFGVANEGGEVGKEVREWLVRVEKELQVWKIGMQGAQE